MSINIKLPQRLYRETEGKYAGKYRPLEDDLKPQELQIILGSLLGDGSLKINKNYKNARFAIRHAISQQEYFHWKAEALQRLTSWQKEKCIWLQKPSKGEFSIKGKLRFQTRALASLTEIYHWTHKRSSFGRLRLWRSWLNRLGPQALAIWWCDDGALIAQGRQGVFATDSFFHKDLVVLKNYMEKVWGLPLKIKVVKKQGQEVKKINGEVSYRMYFSSVADLQKFLVIILPYIPVKSMLYKAAFLYKSSELQERWISIMLQNTHFKEEDIREVIAQRKSSLRSTGL